MLGDTETGKSNLLRLIADGIVTRFSLEQARLIVVDYRRSLLEAADTGHRIGYAPSSAAAVPHCSMTPASAGPAGCCRRSDG